MEVRCARTAWKAVGAIADDIPIWLDVSMKRFEYVHPAGGNEFTSVRITPSELEAVTGAEGWRKIEVRFRR
jgi:prolyl-tRNA editing enzyme YbaK/EbsC (Cys-tRNA(Pro) deacylase)